MSTGKITFNEIDVSFSNRRKHAPRLYKMYAYYEHRLSNFKLWVRQIMQRTPQTAVFFSLGLTVSSITELASKKPLFSNLGFI